MCVKIFNKSIIMILIVKKINSKKIKMFINKNF